MFIAHILSNPSLLANGIEANNWIIAVNALFPPVGWAACPPTPFALITQLLSDSLTTNFTPVDSVAFLQYFYISSFLNPSITAVALSGITLIFTPEFTERILGISLLSL